MTWHNGYSSTGVAWFEREYDGLLFRAWKRPDGDWAARVVEPGETRNWFDDPGAWHAVSFTAMDAAIKQAVAARRRLLGSPPKTWWD